MHRFGPAPSVLIPFLLCLLAMPVRAGAGEEAGSLGEALSKGTFSLNLRYRYEFVQQGGFDKKGLASTLRTSIQYRSRSFYRFGVGFEVEDVTSIGNERLCNNLGSGGLSNGVTDRPAVADPELTEFNQAYLVYQAPRQTRLQGGRMEQNLDNQRFVGNVGWRQNHQSFDAASIVSEPLKNWRFFYGYVDRQHTITGAARPMTSHLANVRYHTAWGDAAAYGYFLDYDDAALAGLSTASTGLRFEGQPQVGPGRLEILVEYARQQDMGDNPLSFGLDYVQASLGGRWKDWGIQGAYEMLRGNGTASFQTPLGTNHKFNGFADKFLVTPLDGLRDAFVRLSWKRKTASAFADYHHFTADEGNRTYGEELDLQASWTTAWKQQIAVKTAFYVADTFATDTTKWMAWTTWGF